MTVQRSTPLLERIAVDNAAPAEDKAGSFKEAMAHLCSPVSVITSMDDGRPHGTTVSAVMSLSMDPELIIVALNHSSDLLRIIERTGRFGVNLLSSHQSHLATRFASKGPSKFLDTLWEEAAGLPRIVEAAIWVECAVTETSNGGDHTIIVGSVASVLLDSALPPLTYHGRRFGTHVSLSR